jgi:hypothetical protein
MVAIFHQLRAVELEWSRRARRENLGEACNQFVELLPE